MHLCQRGKYPAPYYGSKHNVLSLLAWFWNDSIMASTAVYKEATPCRPSSTASTAPSSWHPRRGGRRLTHPMTLPFTRWACCPGTSWSWAATASLTTCGTPSWRALSGSTSRSAFTPLLSQICSLPQLNGPSVSMLTLHSWQRLQLLLPLQKQQASCGSFYGYPNADTPMQSKPNGFF